MEKGKKKKRICILFLKSKVSVNLNFIWLDADSILDYAQLFLSHHEDEGTSADHSRVTTNKMRITLLKLSYQRKFHNKIWSGNSRRKFCTIKRWRCRYWASMKKVAGLPAKAKPNIPLNREQRQVTQARPGLVRLGESWAENFFNEAHLKNQRLTQNTFNFFFLFPIKVVLH